MVGIMYKFAIKHISHWKRRRMKWNKIDFLLSNKNPQNVNIYHLFWLSKLISQKCIRFFTLASFITKFRYVMCNDKHFEISNINRFATLKQGRIKKNTKMVRSRIWNFGQNIYRWLFTGGYLPLVIYRLFTGGSPVGSKYALMRPKSFHWCFERLVFVSAGDQFKVRFHNPPRIVYINNQRSIFRL